MLGNEIFVLNFKGIVPVTINPMMMVVWEWPMDWKDLMFVSNTVALIDECSFLI